MIHEHFIPALFAEAEPVDLVYEANGKTYIGRYDRSAFDSSKSAEEQNIWQIRLIDNVSEGLFKTQYPNGSKRAVFCWNNKGEYQYKFAL